MCINPPLKASADLEAAERCEAEQKVVGKAYLGVCSLSGQQQKNSRAIHSKVGGFRAKAEPKCSNLKDRA